MSKLEELIQELCPDGVPFVKLEELCPVMRGKRLTKSQLSDHGQYVVYHGSKDTPLGFYDDYNVEGDTVIVVNTGGIGGVKYIKDNFWCSDGSFWIKHNDKINNKFLYYYLVQYEGYYLSQKRVGGVPTIDKSVVSNTRIPVPPLKVQCEIVRILDKFTLLTAELTAELTARRKQYEYYRNFLVSFNNFIQKRKFGNIASIQRGASPRPISQFITNDMDGVNWIKIGDVDKESKYITKSKEKITIDGSKKSRKVKKGDFILSNSMSFGRPYILAIDGCIHDGWLSISDFEDVFISDFLYYLLNSDDIQNEFRKKASFGGAVQNLNADIVRGIELYIPSKDEQQKIINILDRFDKLCNDITSGIPAEIELNNKRYEYYRDKLLSFKEKK